MIELTEEQVLEGKDGYLFLTNDSNRVIDQVEGRFQIGDRLIWNIAQTHAARRTFCNMLGADYHHFVVPDRETVYPQFLPDTVKPQAHGMRPLAQYRASGAEALHRFTFEPDLLAGMQDPPAYPKNDTHWSFAGAERYARMILETIGVDPSLLDLSGAMDHSYDNPGDLGGKIGRPPEPFELKIPASPAVKPVFDNQLMTVGRLRFTQNDERDPAERWLVLHDSFGELLALMLPLCAHRICFIHTCDFDELFALQFRPSRVLMIQIERFFVREPFNGMDWNGMIRQQHARKVGDSTPLMEVPDEVVRA